MKIREVMSAQNLVSVRPDDDLALAAQILLWAGVRHLPVVRGPEVVGVLSERDILQHNADNGSSLAGKDPVERAMNSPAITVTPDEPVVTALTMMLSRKIGCLPVVGPNGLVGIVTRTDLLRNELQNTLERATLSVPPALGTVMTRAPAAVAPETDLFEAAALMSTRAVRHLPVVDPERRVVGMLSDRDLRTAIGDPRRFLEAGASGQRLPIRVSDVMSRTVISLNLDAPFSSAVEHLLQEGIGALPVVDEAGRLVGIVSYVDAIRALR